MNVLLNQGMQVQLKLPIEDASKCWTKYEEEAIACLDIIMQTQAEDHWYGKAEAWTILDFEWSCESMLRKVKKPMQ